MSDLLSRVAGAPITWGVCEVPGWGYQMERDRVLRELALAGLHALELGPQGFLPEDPAELQGLLGAHGLTLVAGFVPAVLHAADRLERELAAVEQSARILQGGGARVLVVGAVRDVEGYDSFREPGDSEWDALLRGLDEVERIGSRHELEVALHPHYGTMIERSHQVERILASSEIGLCIDTGHLLAGGADPVEVTRKARGRVSHVHLKDVDATIAARLRSGELTYHDASARGMYRPLGEGDVDVAAIVRMLEAAGYHGWYVLEQDAVLEAEPPEGSGPLDAAVKSLEFLRGVALRATA